MNLRTNYDGYRPDGCQWQCVDDDTYDGAPDSANRGMIGWGATEAEAIEDLLRLFQEAYDAREDAYEKHAADCRECWDEEFGE